MTDSESFRNNIQSCFELPSTHTGGQVLIIGIWKLFVIHTDKFWCFILYKSLTLKTGTNNSITDLLLMKPHNHY
jgi:hypothetical protein